MLENIADVLEVASDALGDRVAIVQGNSHIHWHVAALPPAFPYRDQQLAALIAEHEGYLDIPHDERTRFARELGHALSEV
jgi:hypothetical protein